MFIRFLSVVALAAVMLAGCNKTPTETSKDVTQAREDASQEVSEARQDASVTENKADEKVIDAQQEYAKKEAAARAKLTEVQSDAMATTAEADFDVAIAEAKGIEEIEKKKCGVLGGAEKTACMSKAAATFAASEAAAKAERDAALVVAAE